MKTSITKYLFLGFWLFVSSVFIGSPTYATTSDGDSSCADILVKALRRGAGRIASFDYEDRLSALKTTATIRTLLIHNIQLYQLYEGPTDEHPSRGAYYKTFDPNTWFFDSEESLDLVFSNFPQAFEVPNPPLGKSQLVYFLDSWAEAYRQAGGEVGERWESTSKRANSGKKRFAKQLLLEIAYRHASGKLFIEVPEDSLKAFVRFSQDPDSPVAICPSVSDLIQFFGGVDNFHREYLAFAKQKEHTVPENRVVAYPPNTLQTARLLRTVAQKPIPKAVLPKPIIEGQLRHLEQEDLILSGTRAVLHAEYPDLPLIAIFMRGASGELAILDEVLWARVNIAFREDSSPGVSSVRYYLNKVNEQLVQDGKDSFPILGMGTTNIPQELLVQLGLFLSRELGEETFKGFGILDSPTTFLIHGSQLSEAGITLERLNHLILQRRAKN